MSSSRCLGVIFSEFKRANSFIFYFAGCRTVSLGFDFNSFTICPSKDALPVCIRTYHCSHSLFKKVRDDVKPASDTIQLFGINGESRGVMKLEKAELLAKQEKCKLLQVAEKSGAIPVYHFVVRESKEKADSKAEKMRASKSLKLSNAITSHDLGIKVKQITEWIEKGHEVKIALKLGSSVEGENKAFNHITTSCKEIATVQNSKKTEAELVFLLTPKRSSDSSNSFTTDHNLNPLKLEDLKKLQNADKISFVDESKKLK